METLLSMTDFVLVEQMKLNQAKNLKLKHLSSQYLDRIFNYANFLKQPLKLEMFVPCDSEGNVLELPKRPWQDSIIEEGLYERYRNDLKQDQQAKERCYFDGFEVDYSNNEPYNKWIRLKFGKLFITFYENLITVIYPFQDSVHITALEQLIPYNLPLTATAQKEIGL